MTPNIAVVHINFRQGPNFRLWLPLFLLWIPAILLTPFVLLALLITCFLARVPFWRSMVTLGKLLCSLPGTDVRVTAEGNHVLVRIL
ncbi:MAG: hypothetical protein WBQ95_01655 [Terracidiphilus sp.]